jgi:hypothetical protein
MKRLRTEDVRALELRCPKLCARDATHIKCQTAEHQIFRDFDDEERRDILKRLLSVDIVILSLHTFFQDIYVLQACAASMRHLVRPGKLTIRTTLMASCPSGQDFSPDESSRAAPHATNTAPGQAHGRATPADEYRADAMQELWAFMLRHYPDGFLPIDARLLPRRVASPGTAYNGHCTRSGAWQDDACRRVPGRRNAGAMGLHASTLPRYAAA